MRKEDFFTYKRPIKKTLLWLILISLLLHLLLFVYFSLQKEEKPPQPQAIEVELAPSTPSRAPATKTKKAAPKSVIKKRAPKKAKAQASLRPPKLRLNSQVESLQREVFRLSDQAEVPASKTLTSPTPFQESPPTPQAPGSPKTAIPPVAEAPRGISAEETIQVGKLPLEPGEFKPANPLASARPQKTQQPAKSKEGKGQKGLLIEGEVRGRTIIFRPQPPRLNLAQDVTVTLSFRVLHDGTVDQIVPLIKGNAKLEQVAIDLVSRYRFQPLEPGAAPQKGTIRVILTR